MLDSIVCLLLMFVLPLHLSVSIDLYVGAVIFFANASIVPL